jgi:hypothetical protein
VVFTARISRFPDDFVTPFQEETIVPRKLSDVKLCEGLSVNTMSVLKNDEAISPHDIATLGNNEITSPHTISPFANNEFTSSQNNEKCQFYTINFPIGSMLTDQKIFLFNP